MRRQSPRNRRRCRSAPSGRSGVTRSRAFSARAGDRGGRERDRDGARRDGPVGDGRRSLRSPLYRGGRHISWGRRQRSGGGHPGRGRARTREGEAAAGADHRGFRRRGAPAFPRTHDGVAGVDQATDRAARETRLDDLHGRGRTRARAPGGAGRRSTDDPRTRGRAERRDRCACRSVVPGGARRGRSARRRRDNSAALGLRGVLAEGNPFHVALLRSWPLLPHSAGHAGQSRLGKDQGSAAPAAGKPTH